MKNDTSFGSRYRLEYTYPKPPEGFSAKAFRIKSTAERLPSTFGLGPQDLQSSSCPVVAQRAKSDLSGIVVTMTEAENEASRVINKAIFLKGVDIIFSDVREPP